MKRLILVRHGKSAWDQNLPDDKRPLKKRGERDGTLVAKSFSAFFQKPVMVWSSPAVRALSTANIFKNELAIEDENFNIIKSLYTFNSGDLYSQIQNCDPGVNNLMVFGHNPAMTNLVNNLGDSYIDNVPTTGLTVIDFETNTWENLKNGKTILSLFPKNLR
ncbi:phosphohistidine phosphatase [Gillisia mitskevichiae]|uniref:Phosphohistidine phosphatase n=1 Tax=Gillisia mitskevichiae TaxID=270921 RepID=A0A495PT12_9FLAO|nr:histidine phosphatase family protein [Gillisia mitskevichiae]RKS52920.1 phosphohistidine phosphatase [Gillisia mitskevichiae]